MTAPTLNNVFDVSSWMYGYADSNALPPDPPASSGSITRPGRSTPAWTTRPGSHGAASSPGATTPPSSSASRAPIRAASSSARPSWRPGPGGSRALLRPCAGGPRPGGRVRHDGGRGRKGEGPSGQRRRHRPLARRCGGRLRVDPARPRRHDLRRARHRRGRLRLPGGNLTNYVTYGDPVGNYSATPRNYEGAFLYDAEIRRVGDRPHRLLRRSARAGGAPAADRGDRAVRPLLPQLRSLPRPPGGRRPRGDLPSADLLRRPVLAVPQCRRAGPGRCEPDRRRHGVSEPLRRSPRPQRAGQRRLLHDPQQ